MRALANDMLHGSAGRSDYMRRRCEAVRDTCDWIAGQRTLSPATGASIRPDESGLRIERMRGEDLEAKRRRERDGDPVRPGVAAQTILWYLLDEYTEPPL